MSNRAGPFPCLDAYRGIGMLLVMTNHVQFSSGIRFRHALPPGFANSIIRSVLLIAALGLVAWKFIDNAAHLGGFLAGCLFAIPLTHDLSSLGRYQPGAVVRSAGAVSAIALVAGAAFTAWKLLTLH